MRFSDHWTRHTVTTPYSGLSRLFAQLIEYQNNDPHSQHSYLRISIQENGNISVVVTPRTHALLSKLIDLFLDEKHVSWSSVLGSATLRVTKEDQSTLFRLFDTLVNLDNTLLPIQHDLQELLKEPKNHEEQHKTMRRQRSI